MVKNDEDSSLASSVADISMKLAEAQARIEELVDTNRRLRTELHEMTLTLVNAHSHAPKRNPLTALQRAFGHLLRPLQEEASVPSVPRKNSERDFQMLGALSALQQGRFTGVVIPIKELLANGYATEEHGAVQLSAAGVEALRVLRARLLNTGQYPVTGG